MTMKEPKFKLNNIKIIFGDQFFKDSLIMKLGIESTCTLRCDYWHMMNEVWPSASSFGSSVMNKIRPYLEGMLRCFTKEQWDLLGNKALRAIENDPRKVDKLIAICHKEKYYAGYYLRGIEGNRSFQGSTPAEQNHASNVAHLGKGASWSIAEHIAQLFKKTTVFSIIIQPKKG